MCGLRLDDIRQALGSRERARVAWSDYASAALPLEYGLLLERDFGNLFDKRAQIISLLPAAIQRIKKESKH